MSYQVLARKWRPKSFSDVVGQEHVLTALSNALTLGRLHHAYLFSGTRGVGKTSIARLFAKGLNCELGVTATPCGCCANCRDIEEGYFVDLIEIDAASRTKVEDTREILDNIQYLPTRGRFKVYLIDEVHMLSRNSFNALLKTLEEPPPHAKFLLATTDPQKLPVTILSRCLQFHLHALDNTQIFNQLEKILKAENIEYETRALQLLARAAQGSVRDGLSLTDQAIALGNERVQTQLVAQMLGTLDEDYPLKLVEALSKANAVMIMELIAQLSSLGIDWDTLLSDVLEVLHKIAMLQLLSHYSTEDKDLDFRLRQQAKIIMPQDLQLYYQMVLMGRKELPHSPHGRMGVEMTFLRALAFHPLKPTPLESIDLGDEQAPYRKESVSEFDVKASVTPEKNVMQTQAQTTPTDLSGHSQNRNEEQLRREDRVELVVEPVIEQSNEPEAKSNIEQHLSESTLALLKAREQLRQSTGEPPVKKSEQVKATEPEKAKGARSVFERLSKMSNDKSATNNEAAEKNAQSLDTQSAKNYQWKSTLAPVKEEKKISAKEIRGAIEQEKPPELVEKLVKLTLERDAWAAEIEKLKIPRLVKHLALSTFKQEDKVNELCLHLRSTQRHLNNNDARQALANAISDLRGQSITLSIIEDDDKLNKTPLEWRQAIYEEMLDNARKLIKEDKKIHLFCEIFDAQLDEQSIQPI